MTERPEYVKCIHDPRVNTRVTLCGRDVGTVERPQEFFFQDIDHAWCTVVTGGRLSICPACAQKAIEALREGAAK